MIQAVPGASRQLQLGDEEQIDEPDTLLRLTCCKFGPVPRLESANYHFYNTTTTTTTTGEAEYYTAGAGCIMYNTYYLYNTYNTVLCIPIPCFPSLVEV